MVAYRFSREHILVCVNASNREKDFAWMREHARGVEPVDVSDAWAQLAIQGPKAAGIVQTLTRRPAGHGGELPLHHRRGRRRALHHLPHRLHGRGRLRAVLPPGCRAAPLWRKLLEVGGPEGLVPAGLGARDTLRLEMKFALYGNDIDDAHTAAGGRASAGS